MKCCQNSFNRRWFSCTWMAYGHSDLRRPFKWLFFTTLRGLLNLFCGLKSVDPSLWWRKAQCGTKWNMSPHLFYWLWELCRLFSLRFFTGMDPIIPKCIEWQRHPLNLQALNTLARQSWRPSETFCEGNNGELHQNPLLTLWEHFCQPMLTGVGNWSKDLYRLFLRVHRWGTPVLRKVHLKYWLSM